METNVLAVERRLLHNAKVPSSIYQLRTRDGREHTFTVAERRELLAASSVEVEERATECPECGQAMTGDTCNSCGYTAEDVGNIRGHAAVFDSRSEDLGGFHEYVQRGAFRKALDKQPDARALFNHDPNIVLGNTRNNTLDMREDPKGLHYYATPPKTQAANDVRELIRSGYVTQSSFAFTVERDRWEENEDGDVIRTILEVRDLYDVSPVTYPAYRGTDSTAREAAPSEVEEGELARDLAPDEPAEDDHEARMARLRELQAGAKRRLALAKAKH